MENNIQVIIDKEMEYIIFKMSQIYDLNFLELYGNYKFGKSFNDIIKNVNNELLVFDRTNLQPYAKLLNWIPIPL